MVGVLLGIEIDACYDDMEQAGEAINDLAISANELAARNPMYAGKEFPVFETDSGKHPTKIITGASQWECVRLVDTHNNSEQKVAS